MELDVSSDFLLRIGEDTRRIASKDNYRRWNIIRRSVMINASAAGQYIVPLGSPSSPYIWNPVALAFAQADPTTGLPIPSTAMQQALFCIGDSANPSLSDAIYYSDKTGDTFGTEALWVFSSDQAYLSVTISAASEVVCTMHAREYRLDDILPSSL